jgi:hypothetical protein
MVSISAPTGSPTLTAMGWRRKKLFIFVYLPDTELILQEGGHAPGQSGEGGGGMCGRY